MNKLDRMYHLDRSELLYATDCLQSCYESNQGLLREVFSQDGVTPRPGTEDALKGHVDGLVAILWGCATPRCMR